MNLKQSKYSKYNLVKEMYETVNIIRDFDSTVVNKITSCIRSSSKLMLTGEGSSRIFPAKNMRHHQMALNLKLNIFIEGALQLMDYVLDDYVVIGVSNSGKTKELVELFSNLNAQRHDNLFAITCNSNTPLEKFAHETVIPSNCHENAVAATKSVIAQALVYDSLLIELFNYDFSFRNLADNIQKVLDKEIDEKIIDTMIHANTIYFTGFNNGIAEELTLKTNEILRKKSAFLPGTYLLHGIEEVINNDDAIILVDPIDSELEKIHQIYSEKIGAKVISFSTENTPFLNIPPPESSFVHDGYIKLAIGWNLLVEAGVRMGIDIDKPERARKIGNEFGQVKTSKPVTMS